MVDAKSPLQSLAILRAKLSNMLAGGFFHLACGMQIFAGQNPEIG